MARSLIGILSLVGLCTPGFLGAQESRAIFELWLNEIKKGDVWVRLDNGDVLMQAEDLAGAGLHGLNGQQVWLGNEAYLSLNSLAPGLSFKIDEQHLALRLTAHAESLGSKRLDVGSEKPPHISYSEDTSGFFNYAINLHDFRRFAAVGEAGLTIKNTLLFGTVSRTAQGQFVRGLTNFSIHHPEAMTRTVLGDQVVGADILGGGLILGGMVFQREFGLDPYFVRNPGLTYSGTATVPSTLDIYVNGQRLRRIPVPAGHFDLKDIPASVGLADTRFVLTDAFGRQRSIDAQHYVAGGLLKPGLQDFSYALGAVRNHIGSANWRYGPFALVARHRLGLNEWVTAGYRFETTPQVVSGGPNFSLRLPLGEMDLAVAASRSGGLSGGAAQFNFSHQATVFNVAASLRLMSPHYATVSLAPKEERSALHLGVGLGFPILANVGGLLRYSYEERPSSAMAQKLSLSTTSRITDRVSLYVSGSQSWETKSRRSYEVSSGLSFAFGRTTGALSYENRDRRGAGLVTFQRTLPSDSGFGYRMQTRVDHDGNRAADGSLQYQGPYGRYEAGYNHHPGGTSSVLSAAGGLVAIGNQVLATRPVEGSFALIRAPGLGGVRGYSANQELGITNRNGDLFAPNLIPYYANRLAISDKDIPLNYAIEKTERVVAPPFRGGALIEFPVKRIQRVTGVVTLSRRGEIIIPAFGALVVTSNGQSFESPLGRQGEFYLENLPAGRHRAAVLFNAERCELELTLANSDQAELKLGELTCGMH